MATGRTVALVSFQDEKRCFPAIELVIVGWLIGRKTIEDELVNFQNKAPLALGR